MAYATPFVTYGLIAICVLMFIGPQKGLSGGLGFGSSISQQSINDFALVGPDGRGTATGGGWSPRMFLHGSIIHLGFNMYALWIFGPAIERRYGPLRYLALYIVGRPVRQRGRADPVTERLHGRRLGCHLRPDGRVRRDRAGAGLA